MVPPELDAIILRALARDRDKRWATAADMADALDDVVHAARFTPAHLAQLLHDLFPVEGGAPAPRLSVNASSQVTSSSIRALRSLIRVVRQVAQPKALKVKKGAGHFERARLVAKANAAAAKNATRTPAVKKGVEIAGVHVPKPKTVRRRVESAKKASKTKKGNAR